MKIPIVKKDFIEKDGKQILKAKLLFISENDRNCDFCDEVKQCASISAISTDTNIGDVIIVCKDCLEEIIKEFD